MISKNSQKNFILINVFLCTIGIIQYFATNYIALNYIFYKEDLEEKEECLNMNHYVDFYSTVKFMIGIFFVFVVRNFILALMLKFNLRNKKFIGNTERNLSYDKFIKLIGFFISSTFIESITYSFALSHYNFSEFNLGYNHIYSNIIRI